MLAVMMMRGTAYLIGHIAHKQFALSESIVSQKMQANLIFNLVIFTTSLAGWAVIKLIQRKKRRMRTLNILNFRERSHISTISSVGLRDDIHAYFEESEAQKLRERENSQAQK